MRVKVHLEDSIHISKIYMKSHMVMKSLGDEILFVKKFKKKHLTHTTNKISLRSKHLHRFANEQNANLFEVLVYVFPTRFKISNEKEFGL